MLLNVLAVGDVVGEGGQDILSRRLPGLREETGAHFCVVNGENASGVGITPAQARRIMEAGADVITLGNHTWNRIQIGAFLDKDDRILRPANYAGRVPGRGFGVYRCQGLALGVLNIMGRVDLNANLDSPFKAANYFWSRGGFDLMLVDFHAEATSEKGAMGWHLDGRAAAVWAYWALPLLLAYLLFPLSGLYLLLIGLSVPALAAACALYKPLAALQEEEAS